MFPLPPRQRTLTQWIKEKSSTNSFQTACASTLPHYTFANLFSKYPSLNSPPLCFRLPYFDVQPHTGEVYVKNKTLLDREGRSLYTATLQASDTDGKPGTTLLEISLIDINDKSPVFNRDSYIVFVKEGEPFEIKIEVTETTHKNFSKKLISITGTNIVGAAVTVSSLQKPVQE